MFRHGRGVGRHQSKSLFVLGATIILTSITAIGMWADNVDHVLYGVLVIILAVVLPERIMDVITSANYDEENDERRISLEQLNSTILNSNDIVFLDNRNKALSYCIEKIRDAVHVKNMVIRYGKTITHSPNDDVYPKWLAAKKVFLEQRDCELKEIVSKYIGRKDTQRLDMDLFRQKQLGYHCKLIDDAENKVPLMQMTIFHLSGANREVVFGWAFPGRLRGSVFLSRNRELINYLELYFDQVYDALRPEQWAE